MKIIKAITVDKDLWVYGGLLDILFLVIAAASVYFWSFLASIMSVDESKLEPLRQENMMFANQLQVDAARDLVQATVMKLIALTLLVILIIIIARVVTRAYIYLRMVHQKMTRKNIMRMSWAALLFEASFVIVFLLINIIVYRLFGLQATFGRQLAISSILLIITVVLVSTMQRLYIAYAHTLKLKEIFKPCTKISKRDVYITIYLIVLLVIVSLIGQLALFVPLIGMHLTLLLVVVYFSYARALHVKEMQKFIKKTKRK